MTATDTDAQYLQVPATATERLSQLHAAYADAKSAADAASARLKQITDGIKAELQTLAPEQQKVALAGGDGPPMRLVYAESWRVDAKKLKAQDPETYVRFATKSGSWRLTEAKGGASE